VQKTGKKKPEKSEDGTKPKRISKTSYLSAIVD